MSTDAHEQLEGIAGELIRHGLPNDYAQRAAAELEDHRRDLVEELRRAGLSEAEVATAARQRLGDTKSLIRRTVRAYQRRFWCGRWPLITFLLGPIPLLIATWYATALTLSLVVFLLVKLGLFATSARDPFTDFPVEFKYVVLTGMFLIVPALVMYGYARLARRAALGWRWVILAACILGLFAGMWKWERIGPGSQLVMRDRHTSRQLEHPPKIDFVIVLWMPLDAKAWSGPELQKFFLSNPVQLCQLMAPAVVAALFLIRRRQLALRDDRFAVGC